MRENWTYKKLGEVTTTINGLWTGKKPPFINVAVVRNTNFTKDCKLDMTNIAYLDVEQKQYNSRKLFPGDIIIEKSGGSDKQPVGRPVLFDIPDGEYSFSNFTSTLRIKNADEVIPQFLHYVLYGAYLRGETFKLQSKTTGIHNLDFKGYNRLPIPLPSLSEQQSIVAELDKINELISLKKAQLDDLDALAKSIFYDMFGDPIENEKGWEVKKLGEIFETSSGGTPSRSHKEYYDGGTIPWLRSGEVSQGFIHETEMFITEEGLKNSSAKFFPSDTVVVAMYGATVGQVGVIKKKMTTNQAICGIFPHKDFSPTFLYYFLTGMKPVYMRNAAGGAQPNISQGIIKNTLVHIVPPSLQQEFAERIELIEQQKAQISSTKKDLEKLLESRMQYWFD